VRVNSTTLDSQQGPAIGALSDGGYVVSWMSNAQDGSGWGIYAQRYNASGAAVGGEVRVNSTTLDSQQEPAIGALSDGGYVVSWMSYGQDGSGPGIYSQRYDTSGAAAGGEVRVNSTTFDSQYQPAISALSDGGYVVSWTSNGQDGSSSGIYSQRYDASGNPVTDHLEWTGDFSANLIRSTLETDWFNGGTGADTFQFAQLPGDRADLITDFSLGSDVLALNSGLFNLQGQTVAEALANVSGAQNEVAGAHLVFNQNDQTLYYDADGAANGNAVAVVTLVGVASLAASDLQLFG
jgi:predicted RNase H-like HicB family nuclease